MDDSSSAADVDSSSAADVSNRAKRALSPASADHDGLAKRQSQSYPTEELA